MNGSDPPSSSTTFFRWRPAISATAEPARSEPVSETPWTRGSAITSAICSVHRVAFVGAVIENPYPSEYVQDLVTLADELGEEIGKLVGPACVELLGGPVEAFGKAALVGIDGEVEHGSALIHNLRFGNVFRSAGDRLVAGRREGRSPGQPDRHPAQARGRQDALPPPDGDAPAPMSPGADLRPAPPRRARPAAFGATSSRPGSSSSRRDQEGFLTIAETDTWTGQRVKEADTEYVIHSWSVQGALNPIPVAGGSGSWFWDYEGNRYLDFQSQLVNLNLGHQHPEVGRGHPRAGRQALLHRSRLRRTLPRRTGRDAGRAHPR
ncbi:hypothetical protein SHIRM173S_00158 [Streptomyces hirsutus]